METLKMDDHDFGKVNLVTQKRGDFYKCNICGCEGWRNGLQDTITVSEAQFKIAQKCELYLEKHPKMDPPLVFTKELYEVTNSPWPKDLPNGTIIEKVIRKGEDWYTRLDKKTVVDSMDNDNCFKVYSSECERLKNFTYEEATKLLSL